MKLHGLEIVHWNARRNRLPLLWRLPVGPRPNNFGDLLGPVIATAVLDRTAPAAGPAHQPGPRLLTVGSILHMAKDGDVVWGSGVNGKVPPRMHRARHLDVRAVRGPLTAEWLSEHTSVRAPGVYGDPALLLPLLFPELARDRATLPLALVPNLNERARYVHHPSFVDPRGAALDVVRRVASAEAVVSSSLHGFVVAEAFGVPAALLRSATEPQFKYLDYLGGTGRSEIPTFDDVDEATKYVRSSAATTDPLAEWDPLPLLSAFPVDLWSQEQSDAPCNDEEAKNGESINL